MEVVRTMFTIAILMFIAMLFCLMVHVWEQRHVNSLLDEEMAAIEAQYTQPNVAVLRDGQLTQVPYDQDRRPFPYGYRGRAE